MPCSTTLAVEKTTIRQDTADVEVVTEQHIDSDIGRKESWGKDLTIVYVWWIVH
jgi:hypothetical protein